jgi:hypothetical protein
MPANIATTSFSSTPDNKAVTVDVYGSPPLTPTNNTPGKAPSDVLGQAAGINQQGANLLKELAKNYATTGKLFDSGKSIKAASDSLNISRGILREAGGNFLNSVFKGNGLYNTGIGRVVDGIAKSTTGNSLEKMVAGGFKDFSVSVNGVKKVIKNIKDVDSLTDLSSFLNGIAPDNPFLKAVNLTEIAGVIKGAIPFKKLDKSVSESTYLIFLMTFFTPFTETEKSLNPPATIFSKLLPVVDLAIPSTTRPIPVLYSPFPLKTLLRKFPPASRRIPRLIFKLSEAALIDLPESNNLPVVA